MGERPLVTKTCLYCRYWWPTSFPATASHAGECHGLPPSGSYPRTTADDWCALFRRMRRRRAPERSIPRERIEP